MYFSYLKKSNLIAFKQNILVVNELLSIFNTVFSREKKETRIRFHYETGSEC